MNGSVFWGSLPSFRPCLNLIFSDRTRIRMKGSARLWVRTASFVLHPNRNEVFTQLIWTGREERYQGLFFFLHIILHHIEVKSKLWLSFIGIVFWNPTRINTNPVQVWSCETLLFHLFGMYFRPQFLEQLHSHLEESHSLVFLSTSRCFP